MQQMSSPPFRCKPRTSNTAHAAHFTPVIIPCTLQSFKLDPTSGKSSVPGGQEAEHYFAKYLTNMNLLQLQLSDSNFRR